MGFRSTFTIEHYAYDWPVWFKAKYQDTIHFHDSGLISARSEFKTYMTFAELERDIQKSIDWDSMGPVNVIMVWLHECGGVTRVQITEWIIRYSEPCAWSETNHIEHSYCYKCSDLE